MELKINLQSLIDKHIFVSVANRPFGVVILLKKKKQSNAKPHEKKDYAFNNELS